MFVVQSIGRFSLKDKLYHAVLSGDTHDLELQAAAVGIRCAFICTAPFRVLEEEERMAEGVMEQLFEWY